MKINEIFYSLQGEGIRAGAPIIFIRFSGCNLNCKWCDTDHRKFLNYTIEDVKSDILKLSSWGCKDDCRFPLEFTGGEPLLKQDDIMEIISSMALDQRFQRKLYSIQTNGSIIPRDDVFRAISFWSVSPKLPSSGEKFPLRPLTDFFLDQCVDNKIIEMKFVFKDEKDIECALSVIRQNRKPFSQIKIVFQPVAGFEKLGYSMIEDMEVIKRVASLMPRNKGIRVLPQIHKMIGAK